MFLGYFLAVITIFFWGITFISTKILLIDFSPIEILFFRFIAAYAGLWIFHPKTMKIPFKDNLIFLLAGLTGVTLYQFTENVALSYTSASNVSLIVSMCPLFTAIITQIFLKEKAVTRWFVLGFVVAITGVALVCMNGNMEMKFSPKGDLLALLSALCWGFYSLFISILNGKKYDSICVTRRVFFFALLTMIPLVVLGYFKGDVNISAAVNSVRFTKWTNWLNLLFLGLVASAFCFWSWNKACSIVGTVHITKAIYLNPLVTIIFSFFILGEKITWMGALGALITIAGLFISGIKTKKQKGLA